MSKSLTATSNPVDRMSVYINAGLAASSAALVFMILPFIVSAMGSARGYSESELGDATASFYVGIALCALTCGWWVRHFNWRALIAAGLAISGVADLVLVATESFAALVTLFALSGVGAGMVTCVTLTLFGDSDQPDRAFGINLAVQTLPGVAVLFILPHYMTGTAQDFPVLCIVMAVFNFALLFTLFGIPAKGARNPHPFSLRELLQRESIRPAFGLLTTLVIQFGITAPFIFLEKYGNARGFATGDVGNAVSFGMLAVAFGSLMASVMGTRFGNTLPVVGGTAITVCGIAIIVVAPTLALFYLGVILFLLPANFLIAYSLGLTGQTDVKGHMTGFGTFSIFSAPVFASLLTGRIYEHNGYIASAWLGAAALVVATMIQAGLAAVVKRQGKAKVEISTAHVNLHAI